MDLVREFLDNVQETYDIIGFEDKINEWLIGENEDLGLEVVDMMVKNPEYYAYLPKEIEEVLPVGLEELTNLHLLKKSMEIDGLSYEDVYTFLDIITDGNPMSVGVISNENNTEMIPLMDIIAYETKEDRLFKENMKHARKILKEGYIRELEEKHKQELEAMRNAKTSKSIIEEVEREHQKLIKLIKSDRQFEETFHTRIPLKPDAIHWREISTDGLPSDPLQRVLGFAKRLKIDINPQRDLGLFRMLFRYGIIGGLWLRRFLKKHKEYTDNESEEIGNARVPKGWKDGLKKLGQIIRYGKDNPDDPNEYYKGKEILLTTIKFDENNPSGLRAITILHELGHRVLQIRRITHQNGLDWDKYRRERDFNEIADEKGATNIGYEMGMKLGLAKDLMDMYKVVTSRALTSYLAATIKEGSRIVAYPWPYDGKNRILYFNNFKEAAKYTKIPEKVISEAIVNMCDEGEIETAIRRASILGMPYIFTWENYNKPWRGKEGFLFTKKEKDEYFSRLANKFSKV